MPTIETPRLGKIVYKKADVVTFVRPILGFGQISHYVTVSRPDSEPFKWLQSTEDPSVGFAILDPRLVMPNYTVEVSAHDIRQLNGTESDEDYRVFGIVSIPRGHPEQMSINLQAPIITNTKNLKAVQLVLSYPGYSIRHSILKNTETSQH